MEDNDGDDEKLKEEIEAELDKISISSLEIDDVDSDSKLETQSDDSDTSLEELPESVLHCINVITYKSKTAEELIFQDLENTDVLSCNCGEVSNNHLHLRVKLATEYKENPEKLMKILSEIEKEEFLRSKTHCTSPNSAPEPSPPNLPVNEHVLPDDADINFGYCEVEERCRQSFEAWQDKQKELENQEKESLKAQRDKEEKQFQEEEEKRHCWLKQFEVEKKKLENIQKEFIRNLHLQMEEERRKFKDLQEKEKMRLLKLQHNAAVKIQAKYKAFMVYKKYDPIIKEQVENKKRKAQEWKEKEAKIRQKEEKRNRLEKEQRIEEDIRKQKQEEMKKRAKEYEEKKNILRLEREQLSKKKLRIREDSSKQLIISKAFKKGEYNVKHVTGDDTSKNKDEIAKKLMDEKSMQQEDGPLWLVIDEESNEGENVGRQLVLKDSIQIQLKEFISNQAILAELKVEEKNEDLGKQCLENQKGKYGNIDEQPDLDSPDLKASVKKQYQLQYKSQIQNQETVKHVINENVEQEAEIIVSEPSQGISEEKINNTPKIIKDNQQEELQEIEKERIQQSGSLFEENDSSMISLEQILPPFKLEKPENVSQNVVLQQEEIYLKNREIEDTSKINDLNSDIVIFNSSHSKINAKDKINKKDYILGRQSSCGDSRDHTAESSLVSNRANSLKPELPEECHGNRVECESTMTCSIPKSTLLSSIEEKRLAWIKSSKPWFEIFKKNQEKKIFKRKRFVKFPANTMPPLNTQLILQCGPWNTLQQVTTIAFQDLSGYSLSTLAECTNLQFLSLQRCELSSLHSLSNCKKLKYIDAQENHIDTIDCENLENLCIVLLNKNQLTSFYGLDGCTNIQKLELSHNKITRIGGLESLKNLQQLVVDHNQLISTKGLCDTPTIIYLDCSYNHLTEVEGIENCGLLQILKLQGNYLSELPSLENHVLLRELHLDDNSISTVEAFSSYWLPLLQNLTISQNSLTEIVPLLHFVSLEKLDVSNNCLSDLTSAIRCFDACYSIRELSLTGNPLLQEINWRHSLLKILPALRILNGEMLNSCSDNHTEEHCQLELGDFLALCQSQIQEFNLLIENYITGKGNIFSLDGAENLCHYFKKLMTLSNEYRYAHENGDISTTKRDESEAQQNHLAPTNNDRLLQNGILNSCANEHRPASTGISEKWINTSSIHSSLTSSIWENMKGKNQEKSVGQKKEDSKASVIPTKRIPFMETVTSSVLKNCQNIEHSEKIMAAVVIQAYWRGYIVRRHIHFSTRLHNAATGPLISSQSSCIKSQIILKKENTDNIVNAQENRDKAAILIQAVWKGFLLRKKLTAALEAIKNEESEEEYEEIDLEDFAFDEAALEKEWLAPDPACFASQALLLPTQLHWPKYPGTLKYSDTSHNLPSHPAQAWLCNEKENMFSLEHMQLDNRPENRSLSWTPESKTSRKSLLKSEKEEKISEEWGFKDISTAQQMLKRAQKMKSKKLKKNLDPTVRLALFKSNENKLSVTKPPKKAQPRRHGNFEGKEEEFISNDPTSNEKMERSREYTYQWLHTQVGIHGTTSSRSMKRNHFLPELDPDVLNGGRVQLVARLVSRKDMDVDLYSMTSGSALSVNREKKKNQAHRHSAGSSSCSIKGILAPKITNMRPSKKERISFRDNPVQLSGGWGSGKKKEKTSN
ncbi:leucine-rich repeat- and IQ domain-containing protein 1 isoform X2 [Dasypus novemcinctus]|uniref:leucine-rich repeat- and IQ domain-containing protein 1 isoform X2 n=1 Tax=Dasypus novemcinctus TaxID=9361 RepID=UPI00265F423B|nr:leucine-rich repeat and IQ domain-containing protein 1 isoform X2 [Dasypus novemcinctus]XP_058164493.1 leucine-rich repeat and IQ domain-containing protein 1 isoform X2 [Dasypus novemcinctus]